MRFLCPQCKAKYQVADEKIAERSVGMTCRECGCRLQISQPPPAPSSLPAAGKAAPSVSGSPATASQQVPRPTSRPSPPRPTSTRAPLQSGSAQSPSRGVGRPALPSQRGAQRPVVGASRDPRALKGTQGSDQVTAGNIPKAPKVPELGWALGPTASPVPAESRPLPAPTEGNAAVAVSAEPVPAEAPKRWYVALHGKPVGPLGPTELHTKAGVGVLHEQCLVWCEGAPSWMRLAEVPELVALVVAGRASARASWRPNAGSVLPRPPTLRPSLLVSAPDKGPAAEEAAKPVTATGTTASLTRVALSDPFRISSPDLPRPADGVFKPSKSSLIVEADELVLPRQRSSIGPWVAVAAALALGVALGFAIFSGEGKTKTVVQYVPTPEQAAPAVPAAHAPPPAPAAEIAAADDPATPLAAGKRNAPTSADTKTPAASPEGLSGLKGLTGLAPSTPSPEGGVAPKGSSAEGLAPAQIQRTVGRYSSGVQRSCWQPALLSRAKDAPSTARVVVTLNVAPDGSVGSATTSGDPRGYRGLAQCLVSKVRTWQFPASAGSTSVNVPFVFAAQ